MAFETRNPTTGQVTFEHPGISTDEALQKVNIARIAQQTWSIKTPIEARAALFRRLATILRTQQETLARLITVEVGKPIGQSRAEIEKSALVCEYYAQHAPAFLADEPIKTAAKKSYVAHQPLGVILAVMPWNFPFWQVFRFAAPALMAGNTGLLKHASNTPQCALAIERLFTEAGFEAGVFTTLMIRAHQVEDILRHPAVKGVALTGSEPAGRAVAALAGGLLKKSVLELGGSDPFIVLADASLDRVIAQAVAARFQNAGQSCIAAKRFIVERGILEAFTERFRQAIERIQVGDPLLETTQMGPIAREDLREEIHQQVQASLKAGAQLINGGASLDGPGFFYTPTLLSGVQKGMVAYSDEIFGPVASIIEASDIPHAIALANDTPFGLGASVWTDDISMGQVIARNIEAGCCFVNAIVKSDVHMPFGGVKHSGYGRELGEDGLMEFVNRKTIWVEALRQPRL
jgi:succinate-semialdehyde dehydrogenase/glutarate-semialdehyde dehydrogenase